MQRSNLFLSLLGQALLHRLPPHHLFSAQTSLFKLLLGLAVAGAVWLILSRKNRPAPLNLDPLLLASQVGMQTQLAQKTTASATSADPLPAQTYTDLFNAQL